MRHKINTGIVLVFVIIFFLKDKNLSFILQIILFENITMIVIYKLYQNIQHSYMNKFTEILDDRQEKIVLLL